MADEGLENLLATRVLQVERDGFLVPVDREEVGRRAVRRSGRDPAPAVVADPGLLDLDDLGAVVAEDLSRERARDDTGEIDHANVRRGQLELERHDE